MVTKIELEKEFDEENDRLQKELETLEERHKKFNQEHKEDEERKMKLMEVQKQMDRIYAECYEGNWESRDNWYYGRIPIRFTFPEEERPFLKNALMEVYREKEKKITQGEEYKNLRKEYDKLVFEKFSSEHQDLHEKIRDLQYKIDWNSRNKSKIQSRGGLIEFCKDRKRQEEINKEYTFKKERIAHYKELILDVLSTDSAQETKK